MHQHARCSPSQDRGCFTHAGILCKRHHNTPAVCNACFTCRQRAARTMGFPDHCALTAMRGGNSMGCAQLSLWQLGPGHASSQSSNCSFLFTHIQICAPAGGYGQLAVPGGQAARAQHKTYSQKWPSSTAEICMQAAVSRVQDNIACNASCIPLQHI